MTRRLHFGCGPVVTPGWVNFDKDDHGQDHVGDIRAGLPFDTGTFAYVVSHHTLQALPWVAVVPALAELRRVAVKGGWLRLSVPDLMAAVRAYDIADAPHYQIADEHEASLDGKFCLYLTQGGTTKTLFTSMWLQELCERAGWSPAKPGTFRVAYGVTASPWPDIISLDTRPAESLFIEAVAA